MAYHRHLQSQRASAFNTSNAVRGGQVGERGCAPVFTVVDQLDSGKSDADDTAPVETTLEMDEGAGTSSEE